MPDQKPPVPPASSPAAGMSSVYQAIAQSTALTMEHIAEAEAQNATAIQAATAQGVTQIYSTNTAANAIHTAGQLGPTSATLNALLQQIRAKE